MTTSSEFREFVKHLENVYITSNGLPIRIFWSSLESRTDNRIMSFKYSGLIFGIQEKHGNENVTLKKVKTSYNQNSGGGQLYFWQTMIERVERKFIDFEKSGFIRLKTS